MSVWFLYIVRTSSNALYTGIATDVERRLAEHSNNKGARYLRGKGALQLELCKEVGDRSIALKLESLVKKLPKAKKEKLIAKYQTSTAEFFSLQRETGEVQIKL